MITIMFASAVMSPHQRTRVQEISLDTNCLLRHFGIVFGMAWPNK